MKIARGKVLALLVAVGTGGLLLAAATGDAQREGGARGKLRVGVYDSRAVALAYAPSRFNPAKEKMAEFKEAEAKGDTDRQAQLKAWGELHQQQLHWQGFGRYPVDDLLKHIEAELPRIAREAGVDVITASPDYLGADVELVDVTEKLVAPFQPNERTIKWIRDLKRQPPASFATLARMKHDD